MADRVVCGIKMTHDGGIAVIEGDRLAFSFELEKFDSNRRYEQLNQLEQIDKLLDLGGMKAADIDDFVVDGWHADPTTGSARVGLTYHDQPVSVEVAPYVEHGRVSRPDTCYAFDGLEVGGEQRSYSSFHHATGHLFAAYCTSPFAARDEPSLVLVWDGGMLPHLYHVRPKPLDVTALGPIFPITGNAFSDFSAHFGPYRDRRPVTEEDFLRRNLEVAGKAMAYAALGRDEVTADTVFDELYDEVADFSITAPTALAVSVQRHRETRFAGFTDADVIASYQGYLQRQLLSALESVVQRNALRGSNLCLSGGCALNIKWNSAIRASGLFDDVWVPPFPNDSGSALGTATAKMITQDSATALAWDVYAGPELGAGTPGAGLGWMPEPCDAAQLARQIHEDSLVVVVLNGRAELGPRALGNRSILAAATRAQMKRRLNDIKRREEYRPVAPICLEDRAPAIFDPGTPDPYMVFDHRVRSGWVDRIPAVVHLDGTARLQTVNHGQNPLVAELLTEYEKLSGLPLLCNTSANHLGKGFFPDVASAAEWDGVDAIWSDSILYRKAARRG
ncbi:carbamoyltransferase N-terminal domain-containing protein [Streptomyces violaceusniger]